MSVPVCQPSLCNQKTGPKNKRAPIIWTLGLLHSSSTNLPIMSSLFTKYDVPTPRYTSYPTVPQWEQPELGGDTWANHLRTVWHHDRTVSLYVHLPFCESLCTYCGCNKRITTNHGVEQPYLDAVMREWGHYQNIIGKPKIAELHLGGGTPTFFSPSNLEKWLDQLLTTVEVVPGANFSVEVHPNVTTLEHLQVLARLGFTRLSVGIQDFDPEVQRVINRHQTYDQTARIFRWARSLGFTSINADLVYGLPRQSLKTMRDTFTKLQILKPERIAFYSYAHVPWKAKGQRGYSEQDLPLGADKRALYDEGRRLLLGSGYHEIGLDHFALASDELHAAAREGRLHRNFMGYTPVASDVLIGLGASAISDTGTAYAQNLHSVEDYAYATLIGLPVFKGHFLSDLDQEVKLAILDLSCQLDTNWQDGVFPHWAKPALDQLTEMWGEGLLEVSDKGMRITETGRPFLRNICHAIDPRNPTNAGGYNEARVVNQYSRGV